MLKKSAMHIYVALFLIFEKGVQKQLRGGKESLFHK